MKKFWRIVSGLLVVCLLCTLTLWRRNALPDLSGVTAAWQGATDRIGDTAATIGQTIGGVISRPTEGSSGSGEQVFAEYDLSSPLDGNLEEALCSAMQARLEKIDVSAFHLSAAEVKNVMAQIQYSHPELFYVSSQYTYVSAGDAVKEIFPEYLFGEQQIAARTVKYEETLAEIADGVDPTWGDFDKALYLHDYFVRNYTYDYTYTIRDASSFFEQKTGVCQAYMLAFIAAGNAIGLEVLPVTSSEMLHAWNLVRVDGEWYHADLTWDDSSVNPAEISYLYFLRSDNGLAGADAGTENPHRNWSAPMAASDTKYDAAVYHGSRAAIAKSGDTYYCVISEESASGWNRRHGAIYGGTDVAAMTAVTSIGGEWKQSPSTYYTACFSGLCVYEGKLIYNTPNSVRMYDPASGEDTLLGLFTVSRSSIYGILERNGKTLLLVFGTSPQDPEFEIRQYTFEA